MLQRVVLRVVREEKEARDVIEPQIIILARFGVADAQHDRWLDRGVIIRDAIVMREVDVVVVDAADRKAEFVMKTARDTGIDPRTVRCRWHRVRWNGQRNVEFYRLIGFLERDERGRLNRLH